MLCFFIPSFFHFFLSKYHKVNALWHILTLSPFFLFLSSYQCSIFSDIFWGLLLLFIVFVCLDGFDVLRHNWPSLFFFNILYQIITRSIFSDIFWPFPLFLNCFLLVIKIQFSPTYWGPSLTFFLLHFLSLLIGLTLSDIIWPSPFFFSFFIQLSQGQCSPTYFDPSPSFFIFFGLDFKIKFSPTYFGAFPYFFIFCPFWWGWRSPT